MWKKEGIIYGKYLLINVHEICDFSIPKICVTDLEQAV